MLKRALQRGKEKRGDLPIEPFNEEPFPVVILWARRKREAGRKRREKNNARGGAS